MSSASGIVHPVVHRPVRRRRQVLLTLVLAGIVGVCVVAIVQAARSNGPTDGLPVADPTYLLGPARAGISAEFVGTAVAQVTEDAAVLDRVTGAGAGSWSQSSLWALSLAGLRAGSHTVRIWNGGPDRSRIAFVRPRSETDYFRSGSQQWFWDSDARLAVRGTATTPAGPQTIWTATASPTDLSRQLLRSKDVTAELAGSEVVADRLAYGLVLRPTDAASLIDSAYIAVDAATRTPLAVQIFARGGGAPVVDVSYSSIRFAPQPAGLFTFRPPTDATVRAAAEDTSVTAVGTGWAPVLCLHPTDPSVAPSAATVAPTTLGSVVVTDVRGAWGRGRLLASSVLSVLVVDDGRTYAGPVEPAALYAVATTERPRRK